MSNVPDNPASDPAAVAAPADWSKGTRSLDSGMSILVSPVPLSGALSGILSLSIS